MVLNNCTFLWKGALCDVTRDGVSGSSLGGIRIIIHGGGKKIGFFFKEFASNAQSILLLIALLDMLLLV